MTTRWITAQAAVGADADAAQRTLSDDPREVVRNALHLGVDQPDCEGAFPLRDTVVRGADVERIYLTARLGPAQQRANAVTVPIGWAPVRDGMHCSVDGELRLTDEGLGGALLTLTARCLTPPTAHRPQGVIGATQRLVRSTVRAVAAELGAGADRRRPQRMSVRDLMTPDPIILRTDQSMLDATAVLLHHRIAGAPVVDEQGELVGVLSESDMLARAASPADSADADEEDRRRWAVTVGEACSRPAAATHPDTSIRDAARALLNQDVGRLIVVDGDDVVGVLARHDVLRALARDAEELRHAVERALEPLDEGDVHVAVDDAGHVRLEGSVGDAGTAVRAGQIAAAIDGVTGVGNRLAIRTA